MVIEDDIVTWTDNGTQRRGHVIRSTPRRQIALVEPTDTPGPTATLKLGFAALTVHRDWDRHFIIGTDIRTWKLHGQLQPRHGLIEAFPEGKITPAFRIRLDGDDLTQYLAAPEQVITTITEERGFAITKRGLAREDLPHDIELSHRITGHAYPRQQ
ncbi:hypothetical protein FB566_0887 [Stackebrandtia endophytica]|uniref:Uncharacterized protein n=1 Tax=Stackebrandtia endophytica TaxID=1496996 RepID=A0A543AS55_9ACTN|nr:hypothetical protein [Stackebrandtia endophytica]TQL75386.1 hypothetical protein FB566_0887 [Stackebrandtia endophytica]